MSNLRFYSQKELQKIFKVLVQYIQKIHKRIKVLPFYNELNEYNIKFAVYLK